MPSPWVKTEDRLGCTLVDNQASVTQKRAGTILISMIPAKIPARIEEAYRMSRAGNSNIQFSLFLFILTRPRYRFIERNPPLFQSRDKNVVKLQPLAGRHRDHTNRISIRPALRKFLDTQRTRLNGRPEGLFKVRKLSKTLSRHSAFRRRLPGHIEEPSY